MIMIHSMIYILKIMSVLNYQYERGDGGLQESHLMSYRGRVGRPMCPALDVFVPSVDHRVCVRFCPALGAESVLPSPGHRSRWN